MLQVLQEKGEGIADRQRIPRKGWVADKPHEPKLGQRARGPSIDTPPIEPVVRHRVMLVAWPEQRGQEVQVEQGRTESHSSATFATRAEVTRGERSGSGPR